MEKEANITIRCTAEEKKKIRAYAKKTGRKMTGLILWALEKQMVNELEGEDGNV